LICHSNAPKKGGENRLKVYPSLVGWAWFLWLRWLEKGQKLLPQRAQRYTEKNRFWLQPFSVISS